MLHLLALITVLLAADDKKGADLCPAGTEWEGTYKAIEVKVSSTGRKSTKRVHADLLLVVEERKGEKFTGEFWLENKKRGYAIEGVVDASGNFAFKFTKKLKGTWPADMIDNAVVKGVIKKDQLAAIFNKAGNEIINGEIVAKKKTGE